MEDKNRTGEIEQFLHSSKLVSGGFMGNDDRTAVEIIEKDRKTVEELGFDQKQVAAKMQEITDKAVLALGTRIDIDDRLSACTDEAKGSIVCPWPHPVKFDKRVTTVTGKATGESVSWSDLNIHLIAEHGFFEGKGSRMRIEPAKLINLIFEQ